MERKNMKLPEALHRELKIQASKAGMSMVDYLTYLLNKEENNEK